MGTFKRKFFKALLLGMVVVILIVSWLAFGDRGFIYLHKKNKERQDYLERIQKLEAANNELKEEIDKLRGSDREYIERTAREEFDMVKKNEIIYKFTEDEK